MHIKCTDNVHVQLYIQTLSVQISLQNIIILLMIFSDLVGFNFSKNFVFTDLITNSCMCPTAGHCVCVCVCLCVHTSKVILLQYYTVLCVCVFVCAHIKSYITTVLYSVMCVCVMHESVYCSMMFTYMNMSARRLMSGVCVHICKYMCAS